MNAKCAKCGTINTIPDNAKKFCCSSCGILNTPQPETAGTGEHAADCILPEQFEWRLPLGKKESATGEILYLTADDGTGLSREDWVECFKYDPEIVLQTMRKQGKEGVEGYENLSTLGKRKAK